MLLQQFVPRLLPREPVQTLRMFSAVSHYNTDLNSRHLGQGMESPTTAPDVIAFYNMRFCPYAHRTALVLLAKNLPFHVVNVNLKNKPDWFLRKTAAAKVPVIEYQGATIAESVVICEYLEEKFPSQRRLMPDSPEQRARDRELVELSKRFNGPLHKSLRMENGKEKEETLGQAFTALNLFDQELRTRRTDFFGGSQPGLLDYIIWPWYERLDAFVDVTTAPKDRFTHMMTWMSAMMEDPAVKAYAIHPDFHRQFLQALANGTQDYDLLIKKEAHL